MAEYCLRWNNYLPNLVNVFSELLNAEGLVDVTLATEGHYIRAHKLVLSACSVFFRDLFGHNPCTHPIVFLKDINYEDLKTVIDFIYKGEVNVAQDRLPEVLKTAESLKIKGLADRPFNSEDPSSHSKGAHLSSSLSSQLSSLTDSREQIETEDASQPCGSPATKRRKIACQDSTESQQGNMVILDSGHDSEEKCRSTSNVKEDPLIVSKDDEKPEVKKKIKEEVESASTENNPEPESGAVDAMLLLQGSSSETEGQSGSTSNGRELGTSSSLLGSQSQVRGKRGVLKRQTGIIKEAVLTSGNDERIMSLNNSSKGVTTLTSVSSLSATGSGTKLLQVPAVVVGSADFSPYTQITSFSRHYSKPIIATCGQVVRQHSQPLVATSHIGPPPMSKQRSQPSVLTHTMTQLPSDRPLPAKLVTTQHHVSYIPMQLITKQRSSPCTLASFQGHLRPIQPKPNDDPPLIQLTNVQDDFSDHIRLGRTASEEPPCSRNTGLDHLSPSSSPLVQSVSQDTGLDAVASASARPSHMLKRVTLGARTMDLAGLTASTVSTAHSPSLRDGPSLGCNYCWNTPDNQGKVQRRKTKYHCPDCRTNLCIVPCFHEYHNQMQVKQDQQKQVNKMLTKTSSI